MMLFNSLGYGPRYSKPKPFRYIYPFNSRRHEPHTRARECGRGGVNHPMAAQITPRRPGDFTGKAWRRA